MFQSAKIRLERSIETFSFTLATAFILKKSFICAPLNKVQSSISLTTFYWTVQDYIPDGAEKNVEKKTKTVVAMIENNIRLYSVYPLHVGGF